MPAKKEWILGAGCGTLIAVAVFALFYRTAMNETGDLIFHARMADTLGMLRVVSVKEYIETVEFSHLLGYPAWHILCKILKEILEHLLRPATEEAVGQILAVAAALANTIFLMVTYGLYIGIFRRFFTGKRKNLLAVAAACAMIFSGPLYCRLVNPNYYLCQNPVAIWHNPTYLAVEPLALVCFFYYANMAEKETCGAKDFVIFGGLLLLSGFFKPSFYQMFIPGLVIFCVVETLSSKWERFRFSFYTALSVIPAGLYALVQMRILSSADAQIDEANGIAVGLFRVIGYYSPHPVLSILLGLGFPLVMVFLCRRELLKNKMLLLAVNAVLSGLLQFSLLYKQVNTYAADFSWGYSLSLVLMFTVCLILLNWRFHGNPHAPRAEAPKPVPSLSGEGHIRTDPNARGKSGLIGSWAALGVFALHVGFGLLYYKEVLLHMNLYGPLW